MIILVFHFISFLRAFSIFFSVRLSSAEVASSRTNISGFFRNNLAIDILCFSPPESLSPLSQITVLIPSFKSNTNSASADFRAVSISFFVALGFANLRFSSIERLKRLLS
jgi:hypothetical protein